MDLLERLKTHSPTLTKQAATLELVDWAEARERANRKAEREGRPTLPMDALLDTIYYNLQDQ